MIIVAQWSGIMSQTLSLRKLKTRCVYFTHLNVTVQAVNPAHVLSLAILKAFGAPSPNLGPSDLSSPCQISTFFLTTNLFLTGCSAI